MGVCKNVLQEDDILRELHANTRSDVSDYSDNESMDRDSDISATSSGKQFRSSVVAVTSDSETSTKEEESSELENSDDKTSDVWCKTDKKKQAMSLSLEPQ
jgi:flagellar hook-basal body complex protein FliE